MNCNRQLGRLSRRAIKFAFALLLTAVVMLATSVPATAGPFDPPWAGGPNSVHAVFDWVTFNTNWNTSVFETGPSGFPLDPTVPEAFDDGTDTTIILPNFIDLLPLKLVRIQLFYDGPVEGSDIQTLVVGHDPEGAVAIPTAGTFGPAHEHFVDWEIRPNPDWEEIFIFGDTGPGTFPGNLVQIEVHTISIPEPSSIMLACLGLVGMAVCFRRRR